MKRETRLLFSALVSPRVAHNGHKPWGLQNPPHYWSFLSCLWGRSFANISCTDPVTSQPFHADPAAICTGRGPTRPILKINRTFLSCLRHLFHPPPSPRFPLSLASGGTAALPQDNLPQAALFLLLLSPPKPAAASTCETSRAVCAALRQLPSSSNKSRVHSGSGPHTEPARVGCRAAQSSRRCLKSERERESAKRGSCYIFKKKKYLSPVQQRKPYSLLLKTQCFLVRGQNSSACVCGAGLWALPVCTRAGV